MGTPLAPVLENSVLKGLLYFQGIEFFMNIAIC